MPKPVYKDYDFIGQLSYCCVPACLSMIFNRRNFEHYAQVPLGKRLGLTIPPSVKHEFSGLVTIDRYPTVGGGTRIHLPKFNLQGALNDWEIPLTVRLELKDKIKGPEHLKKILRRSLKSDDCDTILDVKTGAIEGRPVPRSGHALVLTGLEGNTVHYIDPETGHKKTNVMRLYRALNSKVNIGGLWHLETIKP